MNETIGHGEEVAKIFGLKPDERFKLKCSDLATVLGHKPLERTYVFAGDQLMHVGYDDGWSDLYGGDAYILERMIAGLYIVEKIGDDNIQ